MIYLDNAATSYPKPENVYEAIIRCMRDYGANAGRSGHKMAIAAGKIIYRCRELLAELFNVPDPMDIVFTCNATESINLALKGLLRQGDHVITTSMEHNAVARPLRALEMEGIEVSYIQCYSDGTLDPLSIKRYLKPNTRLIAVIHASNVSGALLPIEEIGQIAFQYGVPLLVDAAQTAGIYPIDVQKMHIDLLAFSGHKGLLGPQGTGGLYIKKGIKLRPLKEGGTGSDSESLLQPDIMPDKFESGTLNAPGIAGLSAGVEYIIKRDINNIYQHEQQLTQYLLEALKEIKGVTIYGPQGLQNRVGVVSVNLKGYGASELGHILDKKYDIAARAGLHCAPLAHDTMGTLNGGTLRLSIGCFNTIDDINGALEALRELALKTK